jgi:hypothetical protein
VPGPHRPYSDRTVIPVPDTKDDPWSPFPSRPRTARSAGWPSTRTHWPQVAELRARYRGASPRSTLNCPTARLPP